MWVTEEVVRALSLPVMVRSLGHVAFRSSKAVISLIGSLVLGVISILPWLLHNFPPSLLYPPETGIRRSMFIASVLENFVYA